METQYFNWKTYKLRKWQKYMNQAYARQMHVDVWEFHNGKRPEWFHIHHKDGNTINNDISNLECIEISKHLSEHWKENWENDTIREKMQIWLEKARESAKEWHWSKEWIEWHKEHYEKVKEKFHMKSIRICKNCKKEYESIREWFCSNNCKSQNRRNSWIDNITNNVSTVEKILYLISIIISKDVNIVHIKDNWIREVFDLEVEWEHCY